MRPTQVHQFHFDTILMGLTRATRFCFAWTSRTPSIRRDSLLLSLPRTETRMVGRSHFTTVRACGEEEQSCMRFFVILFASTHVGRLGSYVCCASEHECMPTRNDRECHTDCVTVKSAALQDVHMGMCAHRFRHLVFKPQCTCLRC